MSGHAFCRLFVIVEGWIRLQSIPVFVWQQCRVNVAVPATLSHTVHSTQYTHTQNVSIQQPRLMNSRLIS